MTRLLIAAAVAALAVPAVAQVAKVAPPLPPEPMAMKMRAGPMADGVMTLAEVQSMVTKAFQRKDANRDGVLTQEELAMKGQRAGNRVRNPQGTRPKMDAGAMFNRMDLNKDGMISRAEFDQVHAQRMQRRGDMAGKHAGMHRGMGGMGGMMGARMFTMADTNKDGRVTLAEAQAAATQHFAMADTNRDGRVTADEMKAMHQKMGGMNHHG